MSEEEETNNVEARVGSHIKFSTVWLVPVVALVIGMWMIYSHYAGLGSLIEITFVSGDGIQTGSTKVRSKNVEIGEVLDLRLSEDAENVVLSVRIFNHAEALLSEDSQFWVVRPRIGAGGISGLSTLLSGAFIELSPGSSDEVADRFRGLETPPITPLGTPGLRVTLDSASNRPLNEGDPILFNGMPVGRIEYVHFNTQKRRTYYDAFIAAPYDRLVTERTRFWFSSGVNIDLSSEGLSFEIASLSTLLAGGVAFDVPEGQPLGDLITERAFFTIYPNESAISEMRYENALSFVILFDDSIRGLRAGAPVEFRGVKVGEVVRTDIDYPEITNLLEPDSKIPVLIDVEPARLGFPDTRSVLSGVEDRIDELIDSGLRAGLATGNLLSGRKYIELRYEPGADGDVQTFADYKVIPSIEGQLDQLMANASRTLNAISKLPLDEVADSARIALDEFAVTLEEFRGTASGLEEMLSAPGSDELLGTLNTTLLSFQKLVLDFSEGSATNRELQQSLQSLEQTFRELEPVLRNLRRQPNSLIFGGGDDDDLEPKGAQE
jgi:paraquat-inducible protein B